MRTSSAAWIKRGKHHELRLFPKEGTKVREIYDLFKENKGKALYIWKLVDHHHHSSIGLLTDMYGLDIRRVGKGQYILVGEWFGIDYKDYLAESLKLNKGKGQ